MRRRRKDDNLCKMCRERPAGARSHIFPRAQVMEYADPGGTIQAILRGRDLNRPGGAYDKTILCHECEKRFQHYDTVGVEALRGTPVPTETLDYRRHTVLPGVDGGHLKMFFLHVLWRANESILPDFVDVNIGIRSEELRKFLLNDDDAVDDFHVHLFRFDADPAVPHHFISTPRRSPWKNGPSAYEMGIGLWLANITTSRVDLENGLKLASLRPGRPVVVTRPPFSFRNGPGLRAAIAEFQERQAEK